MGLRGAAGEEEPIAHFCDVSWTIREHRHGVKKIFLGIFACFFILDSSHQAARLLRPSGEGRNPRALATPAESALPIDWLSSRRKPEPGTHTRLGSCRAARRWRPPSPLRGDRRTRKMPFRTRRSSTRATPRGLQGRIGWMVFHSASLSRRPMS